MGRRSRSVFGRLYANATRPEDLPWHFAEPPKFLVAALDQRERPGAALDIGCGAGTFSVYMAKRGYKVTAVDFMPQAVAMTLKQAREAGVDIDVVQADITAFEPEPGQAFDVALDVGCLHALNAGQRQSYAQGISRLLKPGADYILSHLGSRGWWDHWPIGPNRIARDKIEALFGPELKLIDYESRLLSGMPLAMGRAALSGWYWFRQN